MKFRFSSGRTPAKPSKTAIRDRGLTTNLRLLADTPLGDTDTLTIIVDPDVENPGSIPATAARVLGKGGYSVKNLGTTSAGNQRFAVSLA